MRPIILSWVHVFCIRNKFWELVGFIWKVFSIYLKDVEKESDETNRLTAAKSQNKGKLMHKINQSGEWRKKL